MRPICPCKDCQKRTLTCHQFCREYQEWKDIINQINELKHQEYDKYSNRDTMSFWKKNVKLGLRSNSKKIGGQTG